MPFKTLLNALVERVPGAQGAIIADWEGESVDQVGIMDDYDLKVIGAHKGVILHSMREVVDRLGDGDLREIVVTTRQTQILIFLYIFMHLILLHFICDNLLKLYLFVYYYNKNMKYTIY